MPWVHAKFKKNIKRRKSATVLIFRVRPSSGGRARGCSPTWNAIGAAGGCTATTTCRISTGSSRGRTRAEAGHACAEGRMFSFLTKIEPVALDIGSTFIKLVYL